MAMVVRNKSKSKLKIGVTLFVRDEKQTLWENGIYQNCFFLLQLLNRSPIIDKCFIVCDGPGNPNHVSKMFEGLDVYVISLQDAMDSLDVIIELSAHLDVNWTRQFASKGGHIIGMRVANDFVIDTERMGRGLSAGLVMSGTPYSVIWTLPAFERSCKSYYQAGMRANVRVMQHLWSPAIVNLATAKKGQKFAYQAGRKRWRLGIFEPNISLVKTCHVPLVLCDVTHRNNPLIIEHLRVFCTENIRENPHFVAFAQSMDLVSQGLTSFEGRFPIIDVLGQTIDAVICHHWENGQNYLYYEALYGGFPLIHNSAFIDNCGYRYNNYDPIEGAVALLQAYMEHDRNLTAYIKEAHLFLEKLDPLSEKNVFDYGKEIENLFV